MKTIAIYDNPDPKAKIRIINQGETVKILEKQEKMIAEFRKWVWEDEKRKAAYAEKRAMAREKERGEWRELMPYIEEALSGHVERAERLSERIRRLEREDEEQEGTHLALLEYKEQLLRTHWYIEDLKNMRERAKARME